jgi:arylsulfatase
MNQLRVTTLFFLMLGTLAYLSPQVMAQDKPNIVIVFMDNFGWGEPGFNGGGIIRGAATPRMDKLADEGLRLTNFNVEVQCTPSRSALMTGRYAIRSGNGTVPLGEGVYGLVQWEITMAEMLSEAGYATGMYGDLSFVKKQTDPGNSCGIIYLGDGGRQGGHVKSEVDGYKVTTKTFPKEC